MVNDCILYTSVVMNERKESLRPLTHAYIPAYTKERLT